MTWKSLLIGSCGFVLVLWLGFLGLSKIDSREVQTAAIAAVASLAGAVVAAVSAYWVDQIRHAQRSRERVEDEAMARLNRYQDLQWRSIETMETLVYDAGKLTVDVVTARLAESEALWPLQVELTNIASNLMIESQRIGTPKVMEATNEYVSLCRRYSQGALPAEDIPKDGNPLNQAKQKIIVELREERIRLTFMERGLEHARRELEKYEKASAK